MKKKTFSLNISEKFNAKRLKNGFSFGFGMIKSNAHVNCLVESFPYCLELQTTQKKNANGGKQKSNYNFHGLYHNDEFSVRFLFTIRKLISFKRSILFAIFFSFCILHLSLVCPEFVFCLWKIGFIYRFMLLYAVQFYFLLLFCFD